MGYVAGTAQTSTVTPICIATEYAQYPEYHSVGQQLKYRFMKQSSVVPVSWLEQKIL